MYRNIHNSYTYIHVFGNTVKQVCRGYLTSDNGIWFISNQVVLFSTKILASGYIMDLINEIGYT